MKLRKNGLGGIGAGVALFVIGLGIIPLAYCADHADQGIGGVISAEETRIFNNNKGNNENLTDQQQQPYQRINSGPVGPAAAQNNSVIRNTPPMTGNTPPMTGNNAPKDDINNLIDHIEGTSGKNEAANYEHMSSYPSSQPQLAECNPEALAVGIQHFKYPEANPSDLVSIGSRKLHRKAAESLRIMQAAAKRDGVTLTVGSAYRSINYQAGIIRRKKQRGMSALQIYSASAPAGYSEHSTGYVVDFTPIDSSFGNTRAYKWLDQHASEYNWFQSFTEKNTIVSNVMVEPWHWHYKGTPEARELFKPKTCI